MRIQLSSAAAPLAGPLLTQTTLSVTGYTSSTVSVKYETLPANQPRTYQNFVAIWQSTQIPWGQAPLQSEAIPQDGQSGSLVLSGLAVQTKSYIVGYGVGAAMTTIAASAVVYVGGQTAPNASGACVALGLASVGTDSLVVHYQTLAGYRPLTYKNWLGLWQGEASPYSSGRPQAIGKPDQDVSEGDIALNGLSLPFDTTFTLAYFTGPDQTEAAALLTFSTAG